MASLNETAFYSRGVIKYGFIAVVGLMLGRIVFNTGKAVWRRLNPPAPPAPTYGFGVLPPIAFPEQEPQELTYSLETANGLLPKYTNRVQVFARPEYRPSLGALDEAKLIAEEFLFEAEPVNIGDTLYRWSKDTPYPATLEIDIYTKQLKLKVDWQVDPAFVNDSRIRTEEEMVVEAKRYLRKVGLLREDMEAGENRVTYLKSGGREYVPALSLSEADFLQIDFYRAGIVGVDETSLRPAVPLDPDSGVITVIMSGNSQAPVVELTYHYLPVLYDEVETYPLKPVQQAYEELLQGQGYITSLDSGIEEVVVRRVELGYYDSFEIEEYFQPMFIFSGDDDFVGFVPAVQPPDLKNN